MPYESGEALTVTRVI